MYAVPFHTHKVFTTLRVNSPSFSGQTVPLFDSMLVHQGEGLGTPTEPHHTPSPEVHQSPQHDLSSSIHHHVTTATIPTVIPTDIPTLRQYSKRARIAQSSALSTAADEPASPLGDDSQGEAFPTISGLEAGQDRANIIKSSTLPHNSPPRVTSLATDKGSMLQQLNELTDLCTRLQRQQTEMATKIIAQDLEIASLKARIKMLEDKDRGVAEPSGEDATIKGRSLEIREEAAVKKISVPPAVEVAIVSVPTGSGMVPTASPILTTASVVTPYARCKGKEKMVESDTPKKKKIQEQIDVQMAREMEEQLAREDQRINEQIARDAEIARIHAKEELQIEKFIPVWKQIKDFVHMGSKEEGERVKRKGIRLKQESAKKVKTSEEVSEEDLKTMMQLVTVEEVYVEALQVKHLIIYWEIHTEGKRTYWTIIRLGGNTVVYQFFVDMLKHFDREDLNQLWTLVKETLSIRQATSDKEKEL
nr:hypothetical protein [Tanacetum cinerariifolium]